MAGGVCSGTVVGGVAVVSVGGVAGSDQTTSSAMTTAAAMMSNVFLSIGFPLFLRGACISDGDHRYDKDRRRSPFELKTGVPAFVYKNDHGADHTTNRGVSAGVTSYLGQHSAAV